MEIFGHLDWCIPHFCRHRICSAALFRAFYITMAFYIHIQPLTSASASVRVGPSFLSVHTLLCNDIVRCLHWNLDRASMLEANMPTFLCWCSTTVVGSSFTSVL